MPELLDDQFIKKLKPGPERYEVTDADEPGLRLRVYPNGTRAWSYWYRTKAGAARRVKLGIYPALTLAKARKKARSYSVQVDDGADPSAETKASRQALKARKTATTFADLCRAYVAEELPQMRPATRRGWQRFVDAEIIPALGKLLPAEVTSEHVADLKDKIARGVPGPPAADGSPTWKRVPAPTSARRCYEVLRRILEWASAVDPDVHAARRRHGIERLALNPAASAKGYRSRRKARGRSRAEAARKAYTDDQLKAVFVAAGAAVEAAAQKAAERNAELAARRGRKLGPDYREVAARQYANLFALIAHTGVRAHDAQAARWEDVDTARKLWTIHTHKVSDLTGAAHLVPLSSGALAVLEEIQRANEAAERAGSPWVFPADTTRCDTCERAGHTDKDSAHAAKIKAAAGIDGRGLLHRLRDTIKTRMSEHGIDGRVSEAVLGHVPPGIVGVYDHAELLPQRRAALEWWSGELARIRKTKE